jgi:molecular chaperone GrpE
MVDIPINNDGEEKKVVREDSAEGGEVSEGVEAGEGAENLASRAAERDEYYDKFLRARAELENYRKRVQREKENMQAFAIIDIVQGLLPVMDDLDRALNQSVDNHHVKHFLKGVKLIESQLYKVLEEKGVTPIKAVGEQFDPNLHEAITTDPTSDMPDGTVVAEAGKGYTYRDKVVRPSKVIVAKKS